MYDTVIQKVNAAIFPSLIDLQVFARKILRLFGDIRRKDIDNEAKAVSKLCTAGRCRNIVEVIRHGWLPNDASYYYIDMEYCSETLNDRILGIGQETTSDSDGVLGIDREAASEFDRDFRIDREMASDSDRALGIDREAILDSESRFMDPKLTFEDLEASNAAIDLNHRTNEFVENMEMELDSNFSESDLQSCLVIVDDLVNALIYIHDTGTVHRDLKPQNGNYPDFYCVYIYSPLFPSRSLLESR